MGTSDLILDRLKQVLPCRDDTSLALRLGVAKSTLSNWRSRDSFPYTMAVQLAGELGLSLDWVLAGIGEPYRRSATGIGTAEQVAEPGASYAAPTPTSARQAKMLELFDALDGEAQREILNVAEEKKRLRDLERRIEEMDVRLKHLG